MLSSSLALAFTDTSGHWADKYIDYLYGKGLISGYPDGSFQPQGLISREEAAQMISNYTGEGSGSAGVAVPRDCEGRWSIGAIRNLLGQKLIEGYEDGTFRPENKITRAEFATMVYKMLSGQNKLDDLKKPFGDTSDHWARHYIETLAGNGYIDGYSDGTFKPESNITRAEAATLLSKIDNGGDIADTAIASVSEAFRSDIDIMPTLHQKMKEAIIATGKIPMGEIGYIGDWYYPVTVAEAEMKVTRNGIVMPYYYDNAYGISSLTIPYSRLLGVLKPEFVYSLGDQSLIDKIESGNSSRKRVALTFDDGPKPGTTEQILDVLSWHGAKATFFVLGQNVADNPDIARRQVAEGHEIGNHSWNHPALPDLADPGIHQQVLSTEMAIYQATGEFSNLLRPPYINIDSRSAYAAGMPVVIWSLDSADYVSQDANAIYNKIAWSAKDGDVVIFHDIHQATADSLDMVLSALENQGYEFVTVSELYGYKTYPGTGYYSEYSKKAY